MKILTSPAPRRIDDDQAFIGFYSHKPKRLRRETLGLHSRSKNIASAPNQTR